jgi:radical SAM family uncharacterized protein/radical SAM-linked protein
MDGVSGLDHLLGEVQRPARYAGGEWNRIAKTGGGPKCRMALCYPDAYEVGMSHLGSRILYHIANQRADTACERVFLPWPDMAGLLRQRGVPLSTLETRTPLSALDILGFTLQHELNYPGVVSVLELGQIPGLAADRDERHPLVIGGGPCAAAPEPVAPFFDALVIGDGEEVLGEIIDLYLGHTDGRDLQSASQREGVLTDLAGIPGVYVPSLYESLDGRSRPVPRAADAPERIERRILKDLDQAPFPVRQTVPFMEIVHDRAQLEINRGCTHGCRFCQAGILYRPVRQRSLETLKEQARAILASTGYEQISLSSLSCTDYPHIVELADAISEEFGDQHVSISLPSLRTDQFGIELAQRVARGRKSAVTLAPEAGSQRLRDVINKNVTEENLREAVTAAFRAGWHSIKLYFMIGLPTETDEDVRAIADTANEIVALGKEELGKRSSRLRVAVTVAGFVPKPHTVFEAEPQATREELLAKHELLRSAVRSRQVQLKLNSPDQTALEGILTRGGRRLAGAIRQVSHSGAGLEAWQEWFSMERWEAALGELGTSVDQEVTRAVAGQEDTPWAHIDTGVTGEFLEREAERAKAGETTPDCREGPCAACGLQDSCGQASKEQKIILPSQLTGSTRPRPEPGRDSAPAPEWRAVVTFSKGEQARFLSHLEVTRALQRAVRRAGLPVAYTRGFHERPRMTIARPLPVGVTGDAELCAIDLERRWTPEEVAKRLHLQMPDGLGLASVAVEERVARSPFKSVARAVYEVDLVGVEAEHLEAAVASLFASQAVTVERTTKTATRTIDILPGIVSAQVRRDPPGLKLELACSDNDLVKPEEVVEALNRALKARQLGPADAVRMHRERLLAAHQVVGSSAASE